MAQFLPLLVMFALAVFFVWASFLASGLLGPKKSTAAKEAPYECGIVPTREPVERFPVRFYLVAMIFIVLDIEIIFLYPWAVQFDALGLFGLVEMMIFTVVVVIALAYLISSGALDWGPRRKEGIDTSTPTSTIRLVHKPVVEKDADKTPTGSENGS